MAEAMPDTLGFPTADERMKTLLMLATGTSVCKNQKVLDATCLKKNLHNEFSSNTSNNLTGIILIK